MFEFKEIFEILMWENVDMLLVFFCLFVCDCYVVDDIF